MIIIFRWLLLLLLVERQSKRERARKVMEETEMSPRLAYQQPSESIETVEGRRLQLLLRSNETQWPLLIGRNGREAKAPSASCWAHTVQATCCLLACKSCRPARGNNDRTLLIGARG